MEFELKSYQLRALGAVESYFKSAAIHGASKAFVLQTNRPYLESEGLPGLPYVCIRLPTGGGKTLLGCHAIGAIEKAYLRAGRCICLWIVPSNAILEQTLTALRTKGHPYRASIDRHFASSVAIYSLREALSIPVGAIASETCIIVSTMAALRVEDTEGRKAYEPAGVLQGHFDGLEPSIELYLERTSDGRPVFSLANVLRIHRPIIIVDEAHNARTTLSFETLSRFRPSAILELTATPQTEHRPDAFLFASNVLYHVSALELKAEEMIKLPIKLYTFPDWRETVAAAVQLRVRLERIAKQERTVTGEYIRPICLLQAQPRVAAGDAITTEVLRKALLRDFKIAAEEIAVATGEVKELEGIDLAREDCAIRYVITVQALREGWDCPYAYVLCSVSESTSARAVEQVLGRVLRMPHAKRKQQSELNCAYAFAATDNFATTARALETALVESGFERIEAANLVISVNQKSLFQPAGGNYATAMIPLKTAPKLETLTEELRARAAYDASTKHLVVYGKWTARDVAQLGQVLKSPEDRRYLTAVLKGARPAVPEAEIGSPLQVPLLARQSTGGLIQFDVDALIELAWTLASCSEQLAPTEYEPRQQRGRAGEVDVATTGRIETRFLDDLHRDLFALRASEQWSSRDLVRWLDREIRHPDIAQELMISFLQKTLDYLIRVRKLTFAELVADRHRLAEAIEGRLDGCREQIARRRFDLFTDGGLKKELFVSEKLNWVFTEERYAPNWYYEGKYRFLKHACAFVGELKAQGEEHDCAVFLDQWKAVKRWVRNLERRAETSFWLQTSSDRFYPDFIVELKDGRILVVEYKGLDRFDNDDSREKRVIGGVWAELSGGRGVFVMPKGPDWAAIERAVSKN